MSAVVYSRWELRPGADRVALGNTALELCRFNRSLEGSLSSRYFWPDANAVVILHEVDNPRVVFPGPSADGARIAFNMSDLANRTAFEIWSGAGQGTETNRLAGR